MQMTEVFIKIFLEDIIAYSVAVFMLSVFVSMLLKAIVREVNIIVAIRKLVGV